MRDKKILIGVTGSIAAYKTVHLIRLLKKAGAEVRVIMTPAACEFITPLTLSVVSENPVCIKPFNKADGSWNNHVELGMWADLFLIAPASANTLAKMAHGMADNFLLTVFLSSLCRVIAAPAMDLDMWNHPSSKSNLKILQDRGVIILEPATGSLASGLEGTGRMQEPEIIFDSVNNLFGTVSILKGKKALVTAGPTYEAIDPVRYIGNRSSGKMGFAIAEALAAAGADVVLVAGPAHLETPYGVTRIDVVSASEMRTAVKKYSSRSRLIVMAAAIADYRPVKASALKIKKSGNLQEIRLEPTDDILEGLGADKTKGQFLVGFALETDHELPNAIQKLKKKNLDLIVLNSLNDKGAGFGFDTNKVTLIDKKGKTETFGLATKKEIAFRLVKKISSLIT